MRIVQMTALVAYRTLKEMLWLATRLTFSTLAVFGFWMLWLLWT